jgi:hypothetical protein
MPSTTITHLLVDTATVARLMEISKGSGRWEKNTVPVSVGINFRVFTASAGDLALAQQLRMGMTHTGYCEPDQDVAKDDVIVLTAKSGQEVAPQFFRVTGILDPSLIHHRKLALEQIVTGKVA